MARNENLPFPLGSTFWNGDTTQINSTDAFQYEGQEYEVEDEDFTNGTIGSCPYRSNKRRRVRVVRNVNATTLLAKQVAKLNKSGTSAGNIQGQVNGVVASPADKGYPVDEWLPSSGCVQNDLCYVVVDGLAKVTTDSAGTTTLAVGDVVVAGATTAGTVVKQDNTQTGANLYNQIQNAIGRAATAVSANSTDFIVDVGVPVA